MTDPTPDWPLPFYFNGYEMPKWTAQWHLCSLGEYLNHFRDEWDEFVGFQHIWQLQCRLDHEKTVESEDPLIFQIFAQQVLICLIENRPAILEQITNATHSETSAEEVYHGLISGIGAMLDHVKTDGFAYWTSGNDDDLAELRSLIQHHQSPDGLEPPHAIQRRSEQERRIQSQQKELRYLAQSGLLDKPLRKIANQVSTP
ncbi:hypothetical protein JIN85_11925 [Luteolibacter pohnpeiensis]|uniref:Uncharacterized protein n=1 Tax=Luteolibacter pohnpeiensis TaxID=454153 RepID=A0A934VX30_9BACT|nr:hypothetical protein [Luteolibacter pohnpeiensis]MBK1883129.1 hypothetical protein [Luteolibacter pohnpeiensis]